MEMSGNLINDFIELTGCTEIEAQNMLELSNFSLENAVNLYWEFSGNISTNLSDSL